MSGKTRLKSWTQLILPDMIQEIVDLIDVPHSAGFEGDDPLDLLAETRSSIVVEFLQTNWNNRNFWRTSLIDAIVPIIFGWPAVIAGLLLCAGGILARRPLLVLGGAILAAPFTLYLGLTPRFRFLGPLLWLFLPAAAFLLHRRMVRLAWLFLLPFAILAAWLGWTVLNQ
jgi:hypothetical protein